MSIIGSPLLIETLMIAAVTIFGVLKLAAATEPEWATWAVSFLPEMLVDHAHCEKKAAGSAVNLLFRYPERRSLQEPLARLAREELGHFESVLGVLEGLEIAFKRQRPSPYGGLLHQIIRPREPERLLDILLCCAVVEARSCERLLLLESVLPEKDVRHLYRDLLASEARHNRIYLEMAEDIAGARAVSGRLSEVFDHEARVLAEAPSLPRLHAGEGFVKFDLRDPSPLCASAVVQE